MTTDERGDLAATPVRAAVKVLARAHLGPRFEGGGRGKLGARKPPGVVRRHHLGEGGGVRDEYGSNVK